MDHCWISQLNREAEARAEKSKLEPMNLNEIEHATGEGGTHAI